MNRDGEIMCVTLADATTSDPASLHGTTQAGKCGTTIFSILPLSSSTVRHPIDIICIIEALKDPN